jgi:acetolactate decarboxylase
MNVLALGLLTLAPPADTVLYQYSVLDTLNQANYDGALDLAHLLQRGDFGLGTYNGLNGEMIVLDGTPYRADGTGTLHVPARDARTPFAFVTRFRSAERVTLPGVSTLSTLQAAVQPRLRVGKPYAIRVQGRCDRIKARSFPTQTPPYRPLPELVPTQATFEWRDRRATFVGFFMPQYVGKMNAPGFHFHGVTDDRKNGGHLLELEIRDAVIDLMPIDRFEFEFPLGGVPGSGR